MPRLSRFGISIALLLVAVAEPAIAQHSEFRLVQAKPNANLAAESDRLYQLAGQLYQQGQMQEALDVLQQFLDLSRQIGNQSDERAALNNIGLIYRSLSQYSDALDYYQQALELGRETGDRADEGTILNNIGVVYEKLGQYDEALDYFQEALTTHQETGDRQGEGRTYNSLGVVYNNLGQYEAALDAYNQALAIAEDVNSAADQAVALTNRGGVENSLGNPQAAFDSYNQALEIYRQLGDRPGQGTTLMNLGLIYESFGEYAEAIDRLEESLEIRQDVGDRAGEAATLSSLGLVYRAVGQPQQALEFHNRALSIRQQIGDRSGEASSLSYLGSLYVALGDFAKAEDFLNQALVIRWDIGDRTGEANTLNSLGGVYDEREQYDQALRIYEQSLEIAQDLGNRQGEAAALNNLGKTYDNLNQLDRAVEAYQAALAIVREIGNRSAEGIVLHNLGSIFLKKSDIDAAEQTLFSAIEVLESLRPGLTDDNKVSIFETQADTYRLLQIVLAEYRNDPLQALEFAERSRSRAFAERLATQLTPADMTAIAEPPSIQDIQQTAQTQNATLVEYSVVELSRRAEPQGERLYRRLYIWVVQPSGEVAFRQVDLVPLGTNSLTEVAEQSRVAAATGRGVPFSDAVLGSLITNTRSDLRSRAPDGPSDAASEPTQPFRRQNSQLRQLHTLLIQPIADLLPSHPDAHVVFLPQGSLYLVPFAALQDSDSTYLIEQHTIRVAPSIQVLDLANQQRQLVSGATALVIGNPTMPSLATEGGAPAEPLPSLPYAEAEATAIANLLHTTALTGNLATENSVVQQMQQARIIHLATHGFLDDVPGLDALGAIALAPDAGTDGFLTSREIFELDLNAELVVLSACDTGRGRITEDGVIGLSRSFLSTGAASVIVSLWAVPDRSTAALMVEFYRQWQQQPDKAQALRQAMLAMLAESQYANPGDWAAFVLIGAD